MSILEQLASMQDRRDEIPNQELAAKLAASEAQDDIQELVDNLRNSKKAIRYNCIKVLYEISAIKPTLIESYADEFLLLLKSKDNRMVWGGMTALGAIVTKQSEALWKQADLIMDATKNGSVITQDWGVKILSVLASEKELYRIKLFPFLLKFLEAAPAKDIPRHAENVLFAAKTESERRDLAELLQARTSELNVNQAKRVASLTKRLGN